MKYVISVHENEIIKQILEFSHILYDSYFALALQTKSEELIKLLFLHCEIKIRDYYL